MRELSSDALAHADLCAEWGWTRRKCLEVRRHAQTNAITGLTVDKVAQAVKNYYKNSAARDLTNVATKNNEGQEANPPAITSTSVEGFWQRLVEHSDIHIEYDHQASSRLDLQREDRAVNRVTDITCQPSHVGERLVATTDRIWKAVAGHGVDHKRIPAREFELLLKIAAHGSAGVLQPDLANLTGQDIRSVPKRTDALAMKNYIAKDGVVVSNRLTSLLRLKMFAEASHPMVAEPVVHETWFDQVVRSLESQPDRLMALPDLHIALGLRGKKTQLRQLRRSFGFVVETGLLRQVTAMTKHISGTVRTAEKREPTLMRCIEMLRQPTDLDRVAWRQADARVHKKTGSARKQRISNGGSDLDSESSMGDDGMDDQCHSDGEIESHEERKQAMSSSTAKTADRSTNPGSPLLVLTSQQRSGRCLEQHDDAMKHVPAGAQTSSEFLIRPLQTASTGRLRGRDKQVTKAHTTFEDVVEPGAIDQNSAQLVAGDMPKVNNDQNKSRMNATDKSRQDPLHKFMNRYISVCRYRDALESWTSAERSKVPLLQTTGTAGVFAEQSGLAYAKYSQSTALRLAQVELNRTHRFEDADGINEPIVPSWDRVARFELDILCQSRSSIYIDPPGSARPEKLSNTLIVVAKSDKIKAFPWFSHRALSPPAKGSQSTRKRSARSPVVRNAKPTSCNINTKNDNNDYEQMDISEGTVELLSQTSSLRVMVASFTPVRDPQQLPSQDDLDTTGRAIAPVHSSIVPSPAMSKAETYDKSYVESHPDETFYHRGAGRWCRGEAPAGIRKRKRRTGSTSAVEIPRTSSRKDAQAHLVTSRPRNTQHDAASLFSVDSDSTLPLSRMSQSSFKKKGGIASAAKIRPDRILPDAGSTSRSSSNPSLAEKYIISELSMMSPIITGTNTSAQKTQHDETQSAKRSRTSNLGQSSARNTKEAVNISADFVSTFSSSASEPMSNATESVARSGLLSDLDGMLSSSDRSSQPANQQLPASKTSISDRISTALLEADANMQPQKRAAIRNLSSVELPESSTVPRSCIDRLSTVSDNISQLPEKTTTIVAHPDAIFRFCRPESAHDAQSEIPLHRVNSPDMHTGIPTPESSIHAFGGSRNVSDQPKTGTIASRRKILALSIINRTGGVFPGNKEMWYAFVTQWDRLEPSAPRPNMRTVEYMLKTLQSNGDLLIETFAFQSKGQPVIRKVIYLPGTSPSSVAAMKDKIRAEHPGHFLPDGVDIRSDLREQIASKSKSRASRQSSNQTVPEDHEDSIVQQNISVDFPIVEGLSVQRTSQGVETIRAERSNLAATKRQVPDAREQAARLPLQRPTGRLSRLLPEKLSKNASARSLSRNLQRAYLPSQAAHSVLAAQYYFSTTAVPKSRFSTLGLDVVIESSSQVSIGDRSHEQTSPVAEVPVPTEKPPRKKYNSRKRKATDDTQDNELHRPTEKEPADKKQKKWSGPFQDVDRLVTAVAMVRCLCSGYTQTYTKWPIVAHALRFRYPAQKLQQSWNFQKQTRSNDVLELEKALREPLLSAYERGEVPRIDFQDLEHTDWVALYDWVELNIAAPLRDKKRAAGVPRSVGPDMEDTLEKIAEQFEAVESPSIYEPDRNAFYIHPTSNGRAALIRSYTYTDALPLENGNSVTDELMLLKSWCRAVIATKDWRYDAKAAAAKIGEFPTSLVKRSNSELIKAHVLQPSKKSRLMPGRSYHFHESFWKMFKRWPLDDHSHLRDVADAFIAITSEIEQSGHHQLQRNASNAEMTVLTNLVAMNCIRILTILPERNDDFEAPFPRLSAFGYLDYNYDTKKMDRTRLRFPIIYEKGSRWTQWNGLRPVPVPQSPAPFPGDHDRSRLPFWIDIHGHLIDDVWDLTLRSILHLVVFRPGSTSVMMAKAHQGKLWEWEIDIVLAWMEQTGLAHRWGAGKEAAGVWKGGWRASEWWFCAFASNVATWKAPKPPQMQVRETTQGPESSRVCFRGFTHHTRNVAVTDMICQQSDRVTEWLSRCVRVDEYLYITTIPASDISCAGQVSIMRKGSVSSILEPVATQQNWSP
nr:hypothetical protein CFP56_03243 [Quercus suber]